MKIIEDVKLDFDDVLIRPKRSKVTSRRDVDLIRNFSFPHSGRELECIPIIAANMDTVGSFNVAKTMAKNNCLTCLHKHYDAKKYVDFYNDSDYVRKTLSFFSIGSSNSDLEKLIWVSEQITKNARLNELQEGSLVHDQAPNICVDVANGYTEQFVKKLSKIRRSFPRSIIMAGNVVTPEMTEELILHGGVDIVKVGIGSGSVCTTRLKTGCFTGDSKVNTSSGPKNIKDVSVGELVLTHDGTYQPVTNVHNNGFKDNLVEINGITCTDDHEFYVVNKSDQNKINEDNIHDFAYWLEAKNISEENHFIIENLS